MEIRRFFLTVISIVFIAGLGIDCTAQTGTADDACLSPSMLQANKTGRIIYAAEYSAKKMAAFDVQTEQILYEIVLPDRPSGLALSPDETQLYVAGDSPTGKVYVIDLPSRKIVQSIWVGHSPCAIAVSKDGKTLYVCNRFTNDVSICCLQSGRETARIAVVREPVAAVLSQDEHYLFVVNHLHNMRANEDYAAAQASVIDVREQRVVNNIRFPNGSVDLKDICLSPDGRYAYVPHVLARYQLPTTQLERGWINTNALSIIDVESQTHYAAVLLDSVDSGAANPWSVRCTEDGRYLCVTIAGAHELQVIDRAGLHEKLAKVDRSEEAKKTGYSDVNPANDLSFMTGLRKRIPLQGKGPRGVALIDDKAYLAEYFSDSIGVMDIPPGEYSRARSIALRPSRSPMSKIRRGEMLFHDACLCFQKWQSCSSCHPDARADGLNWDLLNDGIGNPKNAKSLLLAHETPPSMITGVRDSAEAAVRSGIRYIQFAVCPEEDAEAIDEYLRSLKPAPSPYLVQGGFSQAALRGRDIFQKSNCSSCHPAPLYTNLKSYDVSGDQSGGANQKFDTPTLVELWRTAPYLHDGRALTIEEVFTKYNPNDAHGKTSNLTPQEIHDLAEYILSL
ncbi:MAG: cell surface protein [Candidatus Omnitrophica bacterium]|nr:cell surface protein [Candidatus Omnitrophota bacterium]